jgi:hypothetical protein
LCSKAIALPAMKGRGFIFGQPPDCHFDPREKSSRNTMGLGNRQYFLINKPFSTALIARQPDEDPSFDRLILNPHEPIFALLDFSLGSK